MKSIGPAVVLGFILAPALARLSQPLSHFEINGSWIAEARPRLLLLRPPAQSKEAQEEGYMSTVFLLPRREEDVRFLSSLSPDQLSVELRSGATSSTGGPSLRIQIMTNAVSFDSSASPGRRRPTSLRQQRRQWLQILDVELPLHGHVIPEHCHTEWHWAKLAKSERKHMSRRQQRVMPTLFRVLEIRWPKAPATLRQRFFHRFAYQVKMAGKDGAWRPLLTLVACNCLCMIWAVPLLRRDFHRFWWRWRGRRGRWFR